MSSNSLTDSLKQEARRLGFDLAGACPAVAPPGIDRFRQWLANGYAGEMRYLPERAQAYEHPRHVLDGAESILMLATNYRTVEPQTPDGGQGRVSRYAWGADYHDLIHSRLASLVEFHRRHRPEARVRGVVDTAPLLEREFAQLAGLGWVGKNTQLLSKQFGSWTFLAALLSSEKLIYDEPHGAEHCGSCRACLAACPTGALVDAYRLDARKCISYLTIELAGSAPSEVRSLEQDWLFGCDACQEACPWNRRTPTTSEEAFRPAPWANPAKLIGLFALDDVAFRERFRRTPMWRSRRRGILRNAAIALGNRPHEPAAPALIGGLDDEEPVVRAACAWALGRYTGHVVQEALTARLSIETDPEVLAEIEAAIH
jgi:epoxyqueuosine reductase